LQISVYLLDNFIMRLPWYCHGVGTNIWENAVSLQRREREGVARGCCGAGGGGVVGRVSRGGARSVAGGR
jgi:hypothetical protein